MIWMKRSDVTDYLHALAGIPFLPMGQGSKRGALDLRTIDGKHHALTVDLHRSNLDRVTAERLVHALGDDAAKYIVMAPFVGAPLGELFAEHGVNFVDLRGNCFLRLGDRYVARIQRAAAAPRVSHQKDIRAPGYGVLLALLVDPALLRAPLHVIATAAGTSRQAPFDMLRRLQADGFVTRPPKGYAWVEARRAELVDRFLTGYRDVLRPRLLLGSWRTRAQDPSALEAQLTRVLGPPGAWRYGGTAAGARLDCHYRGARTAIHVEALPERLPQWVKAMPSADGDLVALRVPCPAALGGPDPSCVHPLVVCAEMLCDADERARSAAQRIRERFL